MLILFDLICSGKIHGFSELTPVCFFFHAGYLSNKNTFMLDVMTDLGKFCLTLSKPCAAS